MKLNNDNLMPPRLHRDKWTVTGDLRGGAFNDFEDNYAIEEILVEKGLLRKAELDSEYSQFWAYFKTKKSAKKFIEKFNKIEKVISYEIR